MMKKRCLTSAVLAALLTSALIFAGCSGKETKDGDETQSGSATQTQSVSVRDTLPAATSAPEDTTDGDSSPDTSALPPANGPTQDPEPPATQDVPAPTPDPEPEPPVTQSPVSQGARALEFANGTVTVSFAGGTALRVGAPADEVIGALGAYKEKLEAPSCVHPGNDVLYYYDGYTVMTSPDASGRNMVSGFEIGTSAAKLANGITVGSTADEVKAAFGSAYTEAFGLIVYDLTGENGGTPCSLSFTCIDGPVASIALTVDLG